MSDALDKSAKRLLRYLVAGSFFMVAGAVIYASQTESLDYCKAIYDAELFKVNSGKCFILSYRKTCA